MLLIEELVRFGARLDDEYHHPVATAAAERWGLSAPRFVRSSASHVLVGSRDDGSRAVLRLRPAGHAGVLDRSAAAAAAWHAAGAPVVDAVPSLTGQMVETVEQYAAMVLEAAEGPTLEELGETRAEELADRAADWGEALALLHSAAPDPSGLPVPVELDLPRTSEVFGVLHGDPEADNVVASDSGLRFIDPDEVRCGWFVADLAFALRDWAPRPGVPVDLSAGAPARFLAGYRRVRPMTDEELSWLPDVARAAAQEDLARLAPHLEATPDPTWPAWACDLDGRIRARATALREALG